MQKEEKEKEYATIDTKCTSGRRRFHLSLRKKLLVGLLIGSMCVGLVYAAAYVLLGWNLNTTVVANPKVCFLQWSGPAKANTFTYSVNIFPGLTTVDLNATYGIDDWDTSAHTCGMQIYSLTNTTADIASINCTIYNATNTILNQVWSSGLNSLPTAFASFTASPGNYTMALTEVATAGATPSNTDNFVLNMQVYNP